MNFLPWIDIFIFEYGRPTSGDLLFILYIFIHICDGDVSGIHYDSVSVSHTAMQKSAWCPLY